MRMRFFLAGLAICTLVLPGPAQAQDALSAVEKQIVTAWNGLESAVGDVTLDLPIPIGDVVCPARGKGRLLYSGKTGYGKLRLFLEGGLEPPGGNVSIAMPMTADGVFDGAVAHILTSILLQPVLLKYDATKDLDPEVTPAEALFALLHDECDLELLPESKVAGLSAYVIGARIRKPAEEGPVQPARVVLFFAKDSGVPIRVILQDRGGSALGNVQCSNVKLNGPIDESRFNFVAPANVPVTDLNKGELPPILEQLAQ
jgi:hypothetical protein